MRLNNFFSIFNFILISKKNDLTEKTKMLNKNILVTLLVILFKFDLAISLNTFDFCIAIQEECKGYYDEKQIYQIKCELVKCNSKFNFKCESNVCSKNSASCNIYKKTLSKFTKIVKLIQHTNPLFAQEYLRDKNNTKVFNKVINDCQKKIYEFESNDFCLNGRNCFEIRKYLIGFGFNYRSLTKTKEIDCECPTKQSFKCGKYCATDSNACDYFKSIKNNRKQFASIKDCGNHNITYKYNNIF